MFQRRIRSLREQILGSPDTRLEDDWYAQAVEYWKDQVDPECVDSDADLDYAKWGSWGNGLRMRPAADRILGEWLRAKREFLFSSARRLNGVSVPGAQASAPNVTIETIGALPASGNQDEEYFVLKNRESSSVDLSGWSISGAVDHVFPSGTRS